MTEPCVWPGACRTVSSTPARDSSAPSSSGLDLRGVGQPDAGDQRRQLRAVPPGGVAEHPEVGRVQVGGDVVAVADRQHREGVVEVAVGQHDRHRLEPVVGQHLGERLDGVHARDRRRRTPARARCHGVAVGAERAGGERADEHPCRLRGRAARPGAARGRPVAPPRLARDQRAAARPDPSAAAPPCHRPSYEEFRTVPTSKQRRQAAQRHLQRQLERRAEQARKRRRNIGILVTAIAVVVVVGAALLLTGVLDGDDDPSAAADGTGSVPTTSPAATTNADGTMSCTYAPDDSGNPNLTDVGTPPDPGGHPDPGTVNLLMSTDQGDLTLTLDRTPAPCAAASFVYLAEQGFFDGSPATAGRPAELRRPAVRRPDRRPGSGGPTLQVRRGGHAGDDLPARQIAMAKTGARTRPAASSSCASSTPSCPRSTPSSAPSTRPACRCSRPWPPAASRTSARRRRRPRDPGDHPEPVRRRLRPPPDGPPTPTAVMRP